MYGAQPTAQETERTAFRQAEKRYKLYKSQPPKTRMKPILNETDLFDVVDFHAILDSMDLPKGIYRFHCPGIDRPIFCFEGRPGYYFIPRALTVDEQCHWIRQNSDVDTDTGGRCSLKLVAASVLLRKLRWSTLGLQFDWSKRNYDISLPHNKIPEELCLLAKEMAVPAMLPGEAFQPEAAIVNYFGPSDMLSGHLDDMEVDWSKLIVSISRDAKPFFFLGESLEKKSPFPCFFEVETLYLWQGKQENAFMVFLKDSDMSS